MKTKKKKAATTRNAKPANVIEFAPKPTAAVRLVPELAAMHLQITQACRLAGLPVPTAEEIARYVRQARESGLEAAHWVGLILAHQRNRRAAFDADELAAAAGRSAAGGKRALERAAADAPIPITSPRPHRLGVQDFPHEHLHFEWRARCGRDAKPVFFANDGTPDPGRDGKPMLSPVRAVVEAGSLIISKREAGALEDYLSWLRNDVLDLHRLHNARPEADNKQREDELESAFGQKFLLVLDLINGIRDAFESGTQADRPISADRRELRDDDRGEREARELADKPIPFSVA